MTMPMSEIEMETLALRRKREKSTSRPTRNRNRVRPMLATRLRYGMLCGGKMLLVNPGTRPRAVGPIKIPAMISAMTRGWRR